MKQNTVWASDSCYESRHQFCQQSVSLLRDAKEDISAHIQSVPVIPRQQRHTTGKWEMWKIVVNTFAANNE